MRICPRAKGIITGGSGLLRNIHWFTSPLDALSLARDHFRRLVSAGQKLRVQLDRGQGILNFVRQSRGHASEHGEFLRALAFGALDLQSLARADEGAGNIADLVHPPGLGKLQRTGLFDLRKFRGEMSQRSDQAPRYQPCNKESEAPERSQDRKDGTNPTAAEVGEFGTHQHEFVA